ncbi:general substrate transporter [Aspergillus caelatus]|uniref:General substrate transporter n=1 Tax=Aspergillus caelatus TaxID=61420 RepID=A0A5N7A584_9EURO|nr:general substrate transporter [Aspergillus caelatus]KAE8365014.1 general substrate transporter [Aspergillus caelatus]
MMTVLEHDEKPDSVRVEYDARNNAHDDSIEDIATSWFVWLVALTASIAGGLFGYDTGIISAVFVYLGDDLDGCPTSDSEKELITSLCAGGSFIGAIIAGVTADKYGRKPAIYVGCFLFTIGAILQGAAYSIVQMAVGRLVVGLGVGSASMIVPLYIAEIAPTKARGRLIGLNNMSITGGQVVSYGLGAAFAHVSSGWRYMVGLGAFPSIILACLLPFCPESPRQLIYHGKMQEAEPLGQIKMLHIKPAYFRTLICACGFIVIAQMSGFNTLMYYSATLFDLVGFSNPVAVGLVVSGTNFIMSWVNMMTVDPIGRRRIVLLTSWGMCAGLVAVAIAFSFIPVNISTLELETDSVSTAAIVVLVYIIWFVFCYGVSMGNTAWMNTDLFPMEVPAVGTMWLACSCWAANIIVSSTFLSMMKGIMPSGAFGLYAAICGIGYILIYFFYPEVSGLTLEEIREVFEHGFGVSYSRQLRKERTSAREAEQAEEAGGK